MLVAGVVALQRHVRDVVEVGGGQSAVGQRARSFERDQSLHQIQVAALFQDPDHVMAHDARLRVGHDDRAAEPLDERGQVVRRPGIGGRDIRRLARGAGRSGERDLGVRHQLLVVLERVVAARPGRRRSDGSGPRHDAGVHAIEREQRFHVLVGVRVGVRIVGVAVANQRAGQDRRVRRHEMAEPVGPGAVVGDSPETRESAPFRR